MLERKQKRAICLFYGTILFILFGTLSLHVLSPVNAASQSELQQQIDAKNQELKKINVQVQQTQSRINSLQAQGKTLKNAIASINNQIDQVNYGIRSSEINIDKLALELESLGYKLEDTEKAIDTKQTAISEVLRKLQQNDSDGMLEILLKNKTLADSVLEVQSLRDLQSSLSVSVAELSALQEKLHQTITKTGIRKTDLENEHVTLKSRKVILADQEEKKDLLLKETKNTESIYQAQLRIQRKQQQELLDEIDKIEAKLKADFDPNSIPGERPGFFMWPFALKASGGIGIITQKYGETAYSSKYYKGKPHNGIDIGAPIGTKIYAAADGRVIRTDYNGLYYQYGRYIVIDHGNNLSTLYAHLSRSIVKNGQNVKKGQLIGYVGNTGFTTGPHLHFGAYVTPSGGWRTVTSRSEAGFISIPPAKGLVPIGVTLNPLNYL